jgi:hypothetical protein
VQVARRRGRAAQACAGKEERGQMSSGAGRAAHPLSAGCQRLAQQA